MLITQGDFVLSIAIDSAIVFSIPHEGLKTHELDGWLIPRDEGFRGSEKYLSAIANDANRDAPVASIVRGLLPRGLCDYNRPLSGVPDQAFKDKCLEFAYHSYHRQLQDLLSQAQSTHGKSYLIDLHGFDTERSGIDADLVLGSADGATTPDGLDRRAVSFFKSRGFCVRLAKVGEKFSGGYIVRHHSDYCTSALQIEISSRFRNESAEKEGKYLAAKLREFVLSI